MVTMSLKTLADVLSNIADDIKKPEGFVDEEKTEEEVMSLLESTVREKIFQNVVSSSDSDYYHRVDWERKTCTCPDYVYRRKKEGTMCKHLKKRMLWEKRYDKHFYLDDGEDSSSWTNVSVMDEG